MCDMKNCNNSPEWRVEYQDDNGDFVESHLCTDCFPQDYEIVKHFISVERIDKTHHSTGTEFQEQYIR